MFSKHFWSMRIHFFGSSYFRSAGFPSARSLSDVQESAQYLAGEDMPTNLLGCLLAKTEVQSKSGSCIVVNLTTYDGWLEKVCKRLSCESNNLKIKTLSFSKNLATSQYVERVLAMQLMEDLWKLFLVKHTVLLPNNWQFIKSLLSDCVSMCQHATTTNQRSVDVCFLKYVPTPCGILYPMSMPHQIRRRSGKLGTTQLLDLRCGRTSLGRQ